MMTTKTADPMKAFRHDLREIAKQDTPTLLKKCHLYHTQLRMILNGETTPSPKTVSRICRAYTQVPKPSAAKKENR